MPPPSIMFRKAARSAALALGLWATPGLADLFPVTVSVGDRGSATSEFSTADEAFGVLRGDPGPATINGAYNEIAPASTVIGLRGLKIIARYPEAGPALNVDIPALGFSKAFASGTDRAANGVAFLDYFEANGGGLLSDVLDYFVAETGTDPIAGNPASLMSAMVARDFAMGGAVGLGAAGIRPATEPPGQGRTFGLGARAAHYRDGDTRITATTLPLSYAVKPEEAPWVLVLDLPLSMTDTDGARTYAGSLGLGVTVPVTPAWTLTPGIRLGAARSGGLDALGALGSLSLISNVGFDAGGWSFDVANGISLHRSLPVDTLQGAASYDLRNIALVNGLGVRRRVPFDLLGGAANLRMGLIDTRFLGDDLYVERATDLYLSLASRVTRGGLRYDRLEAALGVTFTDTGYEGVSLTLSMRF